MGLRRAASGTTKVELSGEGGDFLTVRQGISKKDFNALLKALPDDYDTSKGFTPGQAGDFTAGLFAALVVGWSSDAPATAEEYLALEVEDASRVDEALLNFFNTLSPSTGDRKSGEGDSTRPESGPEGGLETPE
jgi:hypothetical protein